MATRNSDPTRPVRTQNGVFRSLSSKEITSVTHCWWVGDGHPLPWGGVIHWNGCVCVVVYGHAVGRTWCCRRQHWATRQQQRLHPHAYCPLTHSSFASLRTRCAADVLSVTLSPRLEKFPKYPETGHMSYMAVSGRKSLIFSLFSTTQGDFLGDCDLKHSPKPVLWRKSPVLDIWETKNEIGLSPRLKISLSWATPLRLHQNHRIEKAFKMGPRPQNND